MSTLPFNRRGVQPAPDTTPGGPAASWPAWTDHLRFEPSDDGLDWDVFPDPDGSPGAGPDDYRWVAEHMGFPQAHDDAPGEPMLPFAEWIRVKASLIRLDGTDAAAWLAREIDRLAELAEALHAETPDQFDGRREVNEDCERANVLDKGYRLGYADARSLPEEIAWRL